MPKSPKFLIDEDLPKSLAQVLREENLNTIDVREVSLRGKSDDEIFSYAVSHKMTLISGDLGFSNVLRFLHGTHSGIILTRFPNEISTQTLNKSIVKALKKLDQKDIEGNLIIIEPGRLRLRHINRKV